MQVVLGMVLAVCGMIWYGNASSKPGGKERRMFSVPIDKTKGAAGTVDEELGLLKS